MPGMRGNLAVEILCGEIGGTFLLSYCAVG